MQESYTTEMLTAGGIVGLVLGIILIVSMILMIPTVFYLITLQKALSRCRPENRTLAPGLVWLLLIPFFSMIWHFFIVSGLSETLSREYAARGETAVGDQGRSIGLAMCILNACSLVPYLGSLCALAGFVCWILYWVRIAEYSSHLLQAPVYQTGQRMMPSE